MTSLEIEIGEDIIKTFEVHKGDVLYISGKTSTFGGKATLYYSITNLPTYESNVSAGMSESFSIEVTYGNHFDLPVYRKYGYIFKGYTEQQNVPSTLIVDVNGHSTKVWDDYSSKTIYVYFVPIS